MRTLPYRIGRRKEINMKLNQGGWGGAIQDSEGQGPVGCNKCRYHHKIVLYTFKNQGRKINQFPSRAQKILNGHNVTFNLKNNFKKYTYYTKLCN